MPIKTQESGEPAVPISARERLHNVRVKTNKGKKIPGSGKKQKIRSNIVRNDPVIDLVN